MILHVRLPAAKMNKTSIPGDEMQAILALEDGRIFRGKGYGAKGECSGEVVFNTSLTGYQEIFTDPSYAGQIVVLTNPQIGNYGTSPEDEEAGKPYIEGLIVREFSRVASNWRSHEVADEYLERHRVPVLADIDTRALVRHLRDRGVMRGVVSSLELDADKLVAKARAIPTIDGLDLAKVVSTKRPYTWTKNVIVPGETVADVAPRHRVVAYDYGIKHNILRMLVGSGCDVTVVPAETSADDVMALKPDGIFLSNGPGDPEAVGYAQENIRRLLGRAPIFGICLGHQLTALANGADTEKLKYGHRGCNHPVKDIKKDLTYITSQNHGYTIVEASMDPKRMEASHRNMNDGTVEGVRYLEVPVFTVQFHPEASPGPMDTAYLFDEFMEMMKQHSEK